MMVLTPVEIAACVAVLRFDFRPRTGAGVVLDTGDAVKNGGVR